MKRLTRSRDKVLMGVCGGIAEFFNIDPTIIRLIWFILTIPLFGTMVISYFICAIIIPEDDGYVYQDGQDSRQYKNTHFIIGIGLILIGVYLLLKIIYPQIIDFSKYWPALLIILGFYILINYRNTNY
jgi:phage shock protein C